MVIINSKQVLATGASFATVPAMNFFGQIIFFLHQKEEQKSQN